VKILHIASAANLGYFPGLEVLVASTLLSTGRDNAVHFHIIDGGIPDSHWEKLKQTSLALHPRVTIHRLAFSDTAFAGFPGMHGSKMPYARLLLGDLLPHVEKLLYVDSDILVTRDPDELLQLDLAGRTVLAGADPTVARLDEDCPWLDPAVSRQYAYFNSGVLVLDLVRWRKLNYFDQCLTALRQQPTACRYWDQTALNYVLRDDAGRLPREYNWHAGDRPLEDLPVGPANLHFCGLKPWNSYAPRIDHHLWRQFYRDVISATAPLPQPASLSQKLLEFTALHSATRWLFYIVMRALVWGSNHEHQRRIREIALRRAFQYPRFLRVPQAEWKAKLAAARDSSSRSATPVPFPVGV
jgi:lipopolysaccharide biosynthesis glycosyltransferase